MIIQAILGLAFVLALLYIILKIMQKYLKPTLLKATGGSKIDVEAISYIDEGTKIVSAIHGPCKYVFVVSKGGCLLLDKYENYDKKK